MKKLFLLLTVMLTTSMSLLAQGTSWQTATLINSGATKTGTLDGTTTEVWYKINVTTEGHVDLVATSTGTLTLSTGSTVYGFKNNATYIRGSFTGATGTYSDVNISYHATDVGKGTYYIRIVRYGGAGSYTLKYTFTPCALSNDPEPNNDYQSSSQLQSGATVQGRLGHRTSDDVTDTEDWYKIVVPEEGHIEFRAISTENLTLSTSGTVVYGFKNNGIYSRGSFTGATGTYSDDTITYQATNVGKGTYYVRINRYGGSGGYRLYYKFTPCPLAADPEPNNDYEHSSLLESGATVQGRLGHRTSDDVTDTEDWYKIVVPEEGHIEFRAISTENLTLSTSGTVVYGFKNNGIYSRGSFTGATGTYSDDTITYQATNVGKGTYYVRINRYGGSGGYRLYYKFTPCPLAADPEPNNNFENAGWLPSGPTKQGRLGYRTSDDVTDTEDWYRFTVTKKGTIEFTVTGTEDLTFSPSGTAIYGLRDNGSTYWIGGFTGSGNYSAATVTYQANDVEKGTYYVRINRYGGSGGYRITYNGPTKTGDVDGNHKVTIDDAVSLVDHLLGLPDPSFEVADADVDGDGKITIGDVTDMIDLLLDKE